MPGSSTSRLLPHLTVFLLLLSLRPPRIEAQPTRHDVEDEASAATVEERFATPPEFQRIELAEGGFGAWLRLLPLRPGRPPVHLYDGRLKNNQNAHHAVVDIDVGTRDLQQCADAVMRLRAEYLLASGCGDAIGFRFTSGDTMDLVPVSRGSFPTPTCRRCSCRSGGRKIAYDADEETAHDGSHPAGTRARDPVDAP